MRLIGIRTSADLNRLVLTASFFRLVPFLSFSPRGRESQLVQKVILSETPVKSSGLFFPLSSYQLSHKQLNVPLLVHTHSVLGCSKARSRKLQI